MNCALLYPRLGSTHDAYYLRISGCGLGNSFYAYFHAFRVAEEQGARLITPAWKSIKPRRLLTGSSDRAYWNLFRPHPDDLSGVEKARALLFAPRAAEFDIGSVTPELTRGAVHRVHVSHFSFEGLHEHRSSIRKRLEAICTTPRPHGHRWGTGGYAAMHVRLGDFGKASSAELTAGQTNARIPLEWYQRVLKAVRTKNPDLPVHLFSDGSEAELAPLLTAGATLVRTGSDIGDLYSLAGARLLVGSNSTFSRWAAFLGDMSTVWLASTAPQKQPTSSTAAIYYVPYDAQNIVL